MRWWGGQYEAADALFERAERIQEASLGREHPWLGYTLAYHALALVDLGELQRAREMYERALAIFEDKLGTDHPEVAETLLSQGRLLATLGEYRAGRRAVERSLELYQRSLGPRHASVATALMQLSELATGIGDVRRAEAHYRQAIAIWEQGYAGRTQTQWAEAVVERADQLLIMRRYAEAGKLYDQAIRAYKETDEPDDPWVGRQLLMLAETKRLAGEPAAAEPLYRRALAIRERASGPVHPEVARILLGLAAAQSGGVAGALELSRRAVAILEAAFGTRHPETGRALAALASHEARSGDLEVAFEQALRAEEIARSHLRLTARSLAEREALTYAAVRVSSLDLLLSLALRSPDPKKKERAFDALIRSRALVLDEMGERHRRLVGSEEPGGVRLATELRAASTRLAFLSLRGPGREALGSYRNRLQRAEEEKERLERQLAEMSFAFRRERDTGRAGLREVAAALPPRSALLSIARFASSELAGSAGVGASSEPAPFYLAFVLLSGRQSVEIAPLGPAAEVGGHVERLQSHMARVGGMGIAEENGAETVFVVPDGALNLVHLAILPVAEERFLLEQGRLLHYLAAERDLVQAEWPETGGGLLALGDPDFDEQGLFAAGTGPPADSLARAATPEAGSAGVFRGRRSACGDFLTMIFDRLPATGREVDEVALVWHRTGGDLTADGTSSDRRARILRGAAASEAAFKADAPGWEVLHLATHGFFLGRRCPSPSTSEAEGSLAAPAENPFLRSGLALAGANHREAALEGDEDGILTAAEIAALDLTGTRWAVLSACDSGLGEIRAGEGVLGLRRAFQIAGARSVIMSLWPVDDEASQSWMKTLYRHRFVEGRSTAEAVHHASLELLRARREAGLGTHPFHWAGFVAAGDWR
jgi:CHAT domain-containing protein/tetratricopeptide (TPR) repeat protein